MKQFIILIVLFSSLQVVANEVVNLSAEVTYCWLEPQGGACRLESTGVSQMQMVLLPQTPSSWSGYWSEVTSYHGSLFFPTIQVIKELAANGTAHYKVYSSLASDADPEPNIPAASSISVGSLSAVTEIQLRSKLMEVKTTLPDGAVAVERYLPSLVVRPGL